MNSKRFYIALGLSLVAHLLTLVYFSSSKITRALRKPVKQIEVTYTTIKSKTAEAKAAQVKDVKLFKSEPAKPRVKLLDKKDSALPRSIGDDIRDISKLSGRLRLGKKLAPKIDALDKGHKVTIPLLETEKITNPKYLSYNQTIRERIKQRAYSYVDHIDFRSGEVYVTFVLSSRGSLKDIKIKEARTHANDYVRRIALRSVKESNFPSFPTGFNYPEFTFNIVISFKE